MIKYLLVGFHMIRHRTALVFALFILLAVARHNTLTEITTPIILNIIALISAYACATCINDIADWKIDKINLAGYKDRPLVNGEITRRELSFFALVFGATSFVLASFVSMPSVILILFIFLMNLAYSLPPLHISHRPLIVPLYLIIAYTFIPYLLGLASINQGLQNTDIFFIPALLFLFLSRICLKDFRDREGDLKNNKPTLILDYGKSAVCALSIVSLTLGAIFLYFSLRNVWLIWGLNLYVLAILFIEWRIYKSEKISEELIAIGMVSRMGNGLLLTLLGVMITEQLGVNIQLQIMFFISIAVVYGTLFFDFVFYPEKFKLEFSKYKKREIPQTS